MENKKTNILVDKIMSEIADIDTSIANNNQKINDKMQQINTTIEDNTQKVLESANKVEGFSGKINEFSNNLNSMSEKIIKSEEDILTIQQNLTSLHNKNIQQDLELQNKLSSLAKINNKSFINNNLTLTSLDVAALPQSTKYATSLSVNGKLITLKDQDGNTLNTISTQDTTYNNVTNSQDGLMSKEDKDKLDGISNNIDAVASNNASNISTLQNEVISLKNNKVDKIDTKDLSTNDFSNEYKNKLDSIENGAEVNIQADWKETNSTSKAFIKNKPSIPSKTQVDTALSSTSSNPVQNKVITTELADKLSKSSGGTINSAVTLNQNSLDSALNINRTTGGGSAIKFSSQNGSCSIGTQLDGLPYYWNADHSKGDYLALKNELPTKISQLTNDAEFETSTNVDNKDLSTLENAKTYTNNKISNMATTDTNQTITASKTFEVGGEKEFVLKIKDNYDYIPIKFYKNSTLIGSLAMNSETGDLYNLYQVGSAAKILNDSMLEIGAFKDDPLPITSGAVYNELTKYATKVALDDKVSKVNGKDLSTNDYSNADKNKLNGIESGAEVNVQSDWNETNSSSKAFIKNKPVIPQGSVLYDSTGQNTDGAMTQKASTDWMSNAGFNINKNIQEINAIKTNFAKNDLSNVTYPVITPGTTTLGSGDRVVQTYISSDSNTWFRLWSSGWKECGSLITTTGNSTNTTVAFPINFSNNKYCLNVSNVQGTASVAIRITQKNTNGFYVNSDIANVGFYSQKLNYYACGY